MLTPQEIVESHDWIRPYPNDPEHLQMGKTSANGIDSSVFNWPLTVRATVGRFVIWKKAYWYGQKTAYILAELTGEKQGDWMSYKVVEVITPGRAWRKAVRDLQQTAEDMTIRERYEQAKQSPQQTFSLDRVKSLFGEDDESEISLP